MPWFPLSSSLYLSRFSQEKRSHARYIKQRRLNTGSRMHRCWKAGTAKGRLHSDPEFISCWEKLSQPGLGEQKGGGDITRTWAYRGRVAGSMEEGLLQLKLEWWNQHILETSPKEEGKRQSVFMRSHYSLSLAFCSPASLLRKLLKKSAGRGA